MDGKKTYIAAILMAATAGFMFFTGQIGSDALMQRILEALAIAGLRHAIGGGSTPTP